MIRDMTVRGFAPRTHKAYIAAVVKLAKHYRRSPDQLDEVQAYLAQLIQERKRSGRRSRGPRRCGRISRRLASAAVASGSRPAYGSHSHPRMLAPTGVLTS